MNILWDFRLFSYGYAQRGVGAYTTYSTTEIRNRGVPGTIYIWGDRQKVPPLMRAWNVQWIPYTGGSWKKDLFMIPLLVKRYNISLYHYWVALGPIHHIGMGLIHPCCRVIATVYDCGVALWNDIPFNASKRRTWYWKMQKIIVKQCTGIVYISKRTRLDYHRVIKKQHPYEHVLYPPITDAYKDKKEKRQRYFITLGGSVHKNLHRVIQAFSILKSKYPDIELRVLGEINHAAELPTNMPSGVMFDDMTDYQTRRMQAAGLVFCSLYEGLGLPVLEAMAWGCPLLLSDIPSLKEIASDAACFVDPYNNLAIAQGMEALLSQQDFWIRKSVEGFIKYRKLSDQTVESLLTLYVSLGQRYKR